MAFKVKVGFKRRLEISWRLVCEGEERCRGPERDEQHNERAVLRNGTA